MTIRSILGAAYQAFDEEAYLECNEDVALAVKAGEYCNGLDHYLKYGMQEQRPLTKKAVSQGNPSVAEEMSEHPLPDKIDSKNSRLVDAIDYIKIGEIHGAVNIYLAHFVSFNQIFSAAGFRSIEFLLNSESITHNELEFVINKSILGLSFFGDIRLDTPYAVLDEEKSLELFFKMHRHVQDNPEDYSAKLIIAIGLLHLFPQEAGLTRLAAEHILSDCAYHTDKWFDPYYYLLKIYLMTGSQQWSHAYKICMYLHCHDPNRPPVVDFVLSLLTFALARSRGAEEFPASVRYLESLSEDYPNDPLTHIAHAYIGYWVFSLAHHSVRGWQKIFEINQAIRHVDIALSRVPNSPSALLLKGMLSVHTSNIDLGISALRRLVEIVPDYPPTYWHLACLYRHKGQIFEAMQAYGQQALLSPHLLDAVGEDFLNNNNATFQMSWTRYWNGDQDKYLEFVEHGHLSSDETEGHTSAELMTWRRLHHAILSDHDFVINVGFIVKNFPDLNTTLIQSTSEFSFELSVDNAGDLFISLGNGCKWDRANRYFAFRLKLFKQYNLQAVRKSGQILIFINQEVVLTVNVATCFTINGDGLLVGDRNKRGSDLFFLLNKFSVRIEKYKSEHHWQKIKMMTMFYGDLFADMLHHSMLPSLLVQDGILSLLKDHEISQIIYCTPNELPSVERYCKKLTRLGISCEIDCDLMSHWEEDIRPILGEAVVDSVARAIKDQSIILFCPPDHVFGRGLANVMRSMKNNQYLVCGHPRLTLEEGYPYIKTLFNDETFANNIENHDLVHLAMTKYPHHVTKKRSADGELWWNARSYDDHYKVRFKEPPPLAFYPTRDIINLMTAFPFAPAFETVDHDLPEFMLRSGRLRAITDSSEFFWIEYCSHFRNYPALRNDYWSLAAQYFSKIDLHWTKSPYSIG